MESSLSTRDSLLVRLCDPDDQRAWAELLAIYGPVIHRLARHRGLQHADAADLCQEVFRSVAQAIGRWHSDPGRGPFRAWLFCIARNRLIDLLRARRASDRLESQASRALGDRGVELSSADSQRLSQHLERQVLQWAAEQARQEFQSATWEAFWRTAVDGQAPRAVARELGVSVGAVYIARSRVMARLRHHARQYLHDPPDGSPAS